MRQYNPRLWLGMIFHAYSRQIIKRLMPSLIFMGLYTALICYLAIEVFELPFKGTTQVHSIFGIVLGLFLVCRMNSAYDRWWEGRSRWGLLVNDSRNLAQKISAMLDVTDTTNRAFFFIILLPYTDSDSPSRARTFLSPCACSSTA